MSSEYRIEKARVPVSLAMASGEHVAGDVFLHPSVPHRSGREEVVDLLNGPEHFFPVCDREGAIRFVRKDHVVEVLLLEQPIADELLCPLSREAVVEVSLETGARYSGAVACDVASARPRLLDWMNRLGQRFIQVRHDAGPRLVNWQRLQALRPLD
jgi:hypothetical protein